jgi:arylsulfatase A-like enzyme
MMKNQILIVFDSLRWDIFKKADVPFLKSLGKWRKAYSPGTYTLPAHISFFAGKLPHTFDKTDYYDSVAVRYNRKGQQVRFNQIWRLENPEAPRPAKYSLDGKNIIEGFSKKGFFTIGTGAVNWFNPNLSGGRYLTEPFEKFHFFDGPNYTFHESSEQQIDWVLNCLNRNHEPYFLFINFGETHSKFVYKNCPWHDDKNPYGDSRKCKTRQRLCFEYLDGQVKRLLSELQNYDLVICSDHGEAMGENGLWGHGFYHKKILEVPLLIRLAE